MAAIQGTNVAAPVVPFDTADGHPSHEARYGRGGYRTAATTAERDAIPSARREAGMLVFVAADQKVYRLEPDLTAWVEFKSGASSWSELEGKPAEFPPSAHPHAVADVTGLQAALDGKATPGDVSSAVAGLVNSAPATLDTLKELADALGNDASFATTVTNSLAEKAPLASPSFTGTVSGITKSMVGLGSVDNTPDASKPISTAMQAALDGKASATHGHAISDVTGLQTALDGKQASGSYAASTHTHAIGDVTGLQTALDGKQAAGSYASASHVHAADDITTGTISFDRLPVGSGGTQVAAGNDARFSDVRTPTAHKSSHAIGGSDALSAADIGAAAASHAHAWADITSGVPSSFAPSAHKTSHATGGDDALSPADIGAAAASHSHGAADITSGTLGFARLPARARAAINVFAWSAFR